MLLGDSIFRQVEAWNLLLAVAFDVKLLDLNTLRQLNNVGVWNTETLNWDADNLQLSRRWFAFFNVAFLKLFHLADPKVIFLFFADPRGDYYKQWTKQQTGCVWTKWPSLFSCRHLHICLLNIWGSVSFVVLTTFSNNSGSQSVGRDTKVGGEQQPQQFAKSQIFRTAHINLLCYISKCETQTDFCEVHIVTIIIPVWFLL